MGFSVSGSAALVFAAALIAFGAWHTAAANSFERVQAAQDDRADAALETANAAVNVTNASSDGTTLTVTAENEGAAQFRLSRTDLVVDGRYVDGWQDGATVAGDADTDLWLPGETLEVSLSRDADRVKLVANNGVADTAEVTAA